jgi:hypothetical protein
VFFLTCPEYKYTIDKVREERIFLVPFLLAELIGSG